jgi:hypothetical protein
MITIHVKERNSKWDASTIWNGREFRIVQSVTVPANELAMELVAAGCPNQGWQCLNDDGDRCMSGSSLHQLATLKFPGQ